MKIINFILFINKMGALLIGTGIYFAIFLIAAYLIQDKVTKDERDDKLRSEYRWYIYIK